MTLGSCSWLAMTLTAELLLHPCAQLLECTVDWVRMLEVQVNRFMASDVVLLGCSSCSSASAACAVRQGAGPASKCRPALGMAHQGTRSPP